MMNLAIRRRAVALVYLGMRCLCDLSHHDSRTPLVSPIVELGLDRTPGALGCLATRPYSDCCPAGILNERHHRDVTATAGFR
jgi:hypothetical protein